MDVFKSTLDGILERVKGVEAAAVIGSDGIAIETVGSFSRAKLDNVAAEFTTLARSVQVSNTEFGSGALQQLAIVTDQAVTLLSAVTGEYFLLVVLGREASLGRARWEARRAKAILEPELA